MTRVAPIPEIVTLHVPFRLVKCGGRKEMQMPFADGPGTLRGEFDELDGLRRFLNHAGLGYLSNFSAPESPGAFHLHLRGQTRHGPKALRCAEPHAWANSYKLRKNACTESTLCCVFSKTVY